MCELIFYGATKGVTGSAYVIKTNNSKILIECGLIQGPSEEQKRNYEPFPFKINDLDAVILSHAHLDHSGRLPKLVSENCQAPIFMTPSTFELLEIMLKDAAYIEQRDIEWENKRKNLKGKNKLKPLYTINDVNETFRYCKKINYDHRIYITQDIEIRFLDAGHILGSSIVEIYIHKSDQQLKKIVFSGDLGNGYAALLRDPKKPTKADIMLLESTYGDRNHRLMSETLLEMEEIITSASRSKGNILIPAFAIGRTQEIIFRLGELYQQGKLRHQAVYLDSPMAISATEVYERYQHIFSTKDRAVIHQAGSTGLDNFLPILHYSRSAEESKMLNNIYNGAIIIAGSGMCNGGRIRHHLKHNLSKKGTHVIIVGFQVTGTPGRALVDGAKTLKIGNDEVPVNASIHTLGGFSAHADQSQLLDWVENFKDSHPDIYLVHGEDKAKVALSDQLSTRNWNAMIPQTGQKIAL